MPSVLIPLARGCEELEAVTIIDLLRRAGIEVVTAGLTDQLVEAARGTVLMPDMTLDDALEHDFDMIVLPGGLPGADFLNRDVRVHERLQRMNKEGKFIAAICAAPRVLADAGLLKGRRATSYPGTLDTMDIPGMTYEKAAVVRDGNIITSRGPGTAMDFALSLIEVLTDRETRDEVDAQLLRPAS